MGLYTGTIKGLSKAPYIDQVKCELIRKGCGSILTDKDIVKIHRVSRFLPAQDCAYEIMQSHGWH